MKELRIVVCFKCGCLYDIHYIDNVKMRKGKISQFECKNCGLVPVVYSNPEHFALDKLNEKESK